MFKRLPPFIFATNPWRKFKKLIFNEIIKFFIENELISPNQLGFKPGDSCINQLLAITHEIYKSFDENVEVRGVFLDKPNAFDLAWGSHI